MKQTIKINESELKHLIKESVKVILNEIEFGGEILHGNNPEDWVALAALHHNLANIPGKNYCREKDLAYRDEENSRDCMGFEDERLGRDRESQESLDDCGRYLFKGSDKYKKIANNLGIEDYDDYLKIPKSDAWQKERNRLGLDETISRAIRKYLK